MLFFRLIFPPAKFTVSCRLKLAFPLLICPFGKKQKSWQTINAKEMVMPKLRDINFSGGRFCVCDRCDTVYTKYTEYKVGQSCPECGGKLLLKELSMDRDGHKNADERSM